MAAAIARQQNNPVGQIANNNPPIAPANRGFMMTLGTAATSAIHKAVWGAGSITLNTVLPAAAKGACSLAPRVIHFIPGGSLLLATATAAKDLFITSLSITLAYATYTKAIPWLFGSGASVIGNLAQVAGTGLSWVGLNTNTIAKVFAWTLNVDSTSHAFQYAEKQGMVTPFIIGTTVRQSGEFIRGQAWNIFSYAKEAAVEAVQPVINAPFEWLGWGLGQTLNFGSFVAPKIAWNFAKAIDMQTWGYIIATFATANYLTTKPAPMLAIEYKRVTRISTAKEFIAKKVDQFVNSYKEKVPTLHSYYDWMFPTIAKPIFNATIAKEIEGIEQSIKNTINNDGVLENLLLEGPPGTGKTMVAAKIAADSGCNFVRMSGVDLSNLIESGSYRHLTEFKKILAFGSDTHRPTILFIDEMDAIGRDKIDHAHRVLREAFLSSTGEPSKLRMIIGTTNNIREMYGPVLNRFGNIIHVGAPDRTNRFHILKEHLNEHLNDIPERAHSLNEAGIQRIAAQTSGLVGRDLQQLVVKLKRTKAQTKDNWMDEETIDRAVHSFIQQKRAVNPSFFSTLAKISNMISDFWHFTLSRMRRSVSSRLLGEATRPVPEPLPFWKRPLAIPSRV